MPERPTGHDVPAGAEGGEAPAGPPAPEPSHAERCRTLVHAVGRGTLCTLAVEPAGYPYGSVASYGLDDAGNPLLFVSLMAEHTQNALTDPRASMLVAEPVPEGADPLASGRATLLGDLARVDDVERDAVKERYLAANPSAGYYIDFGDFVFLRLTVRDIRYVGGYGRMSWVDAAGYAAAEPDPLAGEPAARIVEHMNADHAEAQVLFCRHLAGRPDTTEASMSAVDRYGFEMVAVSPAGRAAVRLGFPEPCATGDEVRRAMVAMVGEARAAAAGADAAGGGAAYARDPAGIDLILGELGEQGYTGSFDAIDGGALRCGSCGVETPAADVGTHELRRTEGASDPADMAALVALTCPACGAKGVLVAGFGPEASAPEADVLAALPVPERVNTVDRT